MGIKKIARPINAAKNEFVEWLKDNNAEDIEVLEGEHSYRWDYYRSVSAFIGKDLHIAYFEMSRRRGIPKISYTIEDDRHEDLSIDEFLNMIR